MEGIDSTFFQLVADVEKLLQSLESNNEDNSIDSLSTIQFETSYHDTYSNEEIQGNHIQNSYSNDLRLSPTSSLATVNRWDSNSNYKCSYHQLQTLSNTRDERDALSHNSSKKSSIQDRTVESPVRRSNKDSNAVLFPQILYNILDKAEEEGYSDCISWQSHGRAFRVHDLERFEQSILPKYFQHIKLSSFQRQLSLYGFTRIKHNRDRGGYYHSMFIRGLPQLSEFIIRTPIKGCRAKHMGKVEIEPDFYKMIPVDTNRSQCSIDNPFENDTINQARTQI
jgi:HSF-type DNA-binding